MTLDQISSGAQVFLDANVLIYIEQHDVQGYTSAHVLSEAAHRMMTIEAMQQFGWPIAGIGARLQKHHSEIVKLTQFQQAIEQVPQLGIQVWDVKLDTVLEALRLSRQYELLSGDALIVAGMESNGLFHLASNVSDFDRVPEITRFAPA
jgi:predicted nucleic acid-binding protein